MEDVRLHIRISPMLKEKAEQMAKEDGQRLSDWIRDLIKREYWLRQNGTK